MQQLSVCLIFLVTLKRRGIIKALHLEKTETTDRILPKLSGEIEVSVKTASLPSQIRGTPREDPMVKGHPIFLLVAIYVTGHIGQGNVRTNRPSMPVRPL